MALRFLNSERARGFRFGRVAGRISGLREANDVIDQLQEQLDRERKLHADILAAKDRENAILLRDVMQLKYEIAQRNVIDTFNKMESPSAAVH